MTTTVINNDIYPPRNVFQLLHKHEDLEFILVTKNQLNVKTLTQNLDIKAGQAVFIPKNLLHVINTYGNSECVGFLFSEKLLSSYFSRSLSGEMSKYIENPLFEIPLLNDDHQHVIEKLNILKNTVHNCEKFKYNEFKIHSCLLDLWFEFVNSIRIPGTQYSKKEQVKIDRVERYLEFISLNYRENISVKEIADAGFTSISECNRIFKATLNITAYEYLIQYRIDRSLEYLKGTGKSIAEIALLVGYGSSSQFSKYFKKHLGMTPRQYRNGI